MTGGRGGTLEEGGGTLRGGVGGGHFEHRGHFEHGVTLNFLFVCLFVLDGRKTQIYFTYFVVLERVNDFMHHFLTTHTKLTSYAWRSRCHT